MPYGCREVPNKAESGVGMRRENGGSRVKERARGGYMW